MVFAIAIVSMDCVNLNHKTLETHHLIPSLESVINKNDSLPPYPALCAIGRGVIHSSLDSPLNYAYRHEPLC